MTRQKPRLLRLYTPRLGALGIPYRDKSAIEPALLELHNANLHYLPTLSKERLSRLLSLLQYKNENPGVEDFRNVLELEQILEGDCEDIASLYSAILTLQRGEQWLPALVEYPLTYHIVTKRTRDGKELDFCYRHGMKRV